MCRRFYPGGVVAVGDPPPVDDDDETALRYELVQGSGGLEDCVRCGLYSMEGCAAIGDGCRPDKYWKLIQAPINKGEAMEKHRREAQQKSWWIKRICPVMSGEKGNKYCEADGCALWRITNKDRDGQREGICTYGESAG